MMDAPWLWIALAAVNLITFTIYGLDKASARSGARRVPERTLLILALIGGSPAAFAACRCLRHKTAKKSFMNKLFLVALLQAVAAGTLLGFAI